MSSFREIEFFQNQNLDLSEEERELEEALSLSDLPITTNNVASNEKNEAKPKEENSDFNFEFGSLFGSISALDGEMCAADEVFSGGQILPYRNSVSSICGSQSYSRSESMVSRGFESRSSSSNSRSSSIRSHYSSTSTSSCSNNTVLSAKTFPMVSKTTKVQNQFHSYPSPKPQILGSSVSNFTHASPIGKKSKMWEVLKLGLVRTPEIELQDLKLRHRTNNFGKSLSFPCNISGNNNNNNDKDKARKSYSNEGNDISDFVLEMQKRKSLSQQQLSKNKIGNGKNGGFFKSCKCSIEAISPMPSKPNYYHYGEKSTYFGMRNVSTTTNKYGKSQNNLARGQILDDKNLAQKEKHEQQQEKRKKTQIVQEKQQVMVMSHHQNRTFEWLKNLSHASVLNS